MQTTTLEYRTDRSDTDPVPALRSAHRNAGPLVAALSEDPARWPEADPIVARMVTEAERVAMPAASAAPRPAEGVPAVVRARELAGAQRRMTAAMERGRLDPAAVERSLVRTRALLAELADLVGA